MVGGQSSPIMCNDPCSHLQPYYPGSSAYFHFHVKPTGNIVVCMPHENRHNITSTFHIPGSGMTSNLWFRLPMHMSNALWKEWQQRTWIVSLNIKHLGYSSPSPYHGVLLITISFVGAIQGFVYCSPLHYCHAANVVAMVHPLRCVLRISIITCIRLSTDNNCPTQMSFSLIFRALDPPLKVISIMMSLHSDHAMWQLEISGCLESWHSLKPFYTQHGDAMWVEVR